MLTIWSLSYLRVKGASSLNTVFFLNLYRVSADKLMFFSKTGCNAKLVEPGFAPLMLFSDPTTFHKISFASLNISTIGMIKMGLSPQDLLVDVSTWMSSDPNGEENGCKSLRKLNHGDCEILE